MRFLTTALLASALTAGPALAQTTAPGATPGAPMTQSAPMTSGAPMNAPMAAPASPGSGSVTGSSNPAVNTGGNAPSSVNASGRAQFVQPTALENGANSFTEGQARTRLEGAGLTQVTDLKKDDQGVWRGRAMQGGRSVQVGFDYKGNIAVQ